MITICVGCTLQPATPPASDVPPLTINSTYATTPFVSTLVETYTVSHPSVEIESFEFTYERNLSLLKDGSIDYFVSNHASTPDDMVMWVAPLAQDGLAIVTHPENTNISSLTIEEVRRIYRGFITNWREVGGDDLEIVLISRGEGSGTRAQFERLVMGQQRTSPNAQVVVSSEATLQLVSETRGAIAYIPYSQTTNDIHILGIENISLSRDTIMDSQYPLRYTIYMLGLIEPQGMYQDFFVWMQSEEAQSAIQARYVPLP